MMETPSLDRYQRLREITLDLASTLDLGVLLNRIVHAASDLTGAQAASILLYDEAKQEMRFEAATNLEELTMRGLVVPVEGSVAGLVVQKRQPMIISDAPEDPRHYSQLEQVTHFQTRSLLVVPMITKNKVIGVLESLNKREGQFSHEDQEMLCALGAQAAVAIENARLFQQSDLISELIHELRTPLASISTAAHLLLRPEIPEEQRRRMVEVIQSETFRLSEMASSFLDLARLESGRAQFQPDVFELGPLLEETAAVMRNPANEKGLTLNLQIPGKLPVLKADRNKLKQVVLNLLSNAIKYNRPQGTITLAAFTSQDEIGFSVQDTGVGIGPESLTHMFEKFYRVPGTEEMASGTGLGLSICKRIVEAHQGTIEVESQAGAGSTFTVRLPLKENL
jgi:signal transduction histidine kinase